MSDIHRAAGQGDAAAVAHLLADGADPNDQLSNGDTALHIAARLGSVAVVEAVLRDPRTNPDLLNRGQNTPLHIALAEDNCDIAELLIKTGRIDVNAENGAGAKPIQIAAWKGWQSVVSALLSHNADPDGVGGRFGGQWRIADVEYYIRRPLSLALARKHKAVARVLLRHHINVNAQEDHGLRPLHLAAYHRWPKCVARLLSAEASTDVQDDEGRSPLHFAVLANAPRCAGALVSVGANPNLRDKDGRTAAHYASAMARHHVLAKILMSDVVEIDAADTEGETALHYCAKNNDSTSAKRLLGRHASIDACNCRDQSPLDIAVQECCGDVMEVLAQGAITNSTTVRTLTLALHILVERNDAAGVGLLVEAGADVNRPMASTALPPLFSAVEHRRHRLVRDLVSPEVLESVDTAGLKPLHRAVMLRDEEMVRQLLDERADVNTLTADGRRWTPLELALSLDTVNPKCRDPKCRGVIRLLLSHGRR